MSCMLPCFSGALLPQCCVTKGNWAQPRASTTRSTRNGLSVLYTTVQRQSASCRKDRDGCSRERPHAGVTTVLWARSRTPTGRRHATVLWTRRRTPPALCTGEKRKRGPGRAMIPSKLTQHWFAKNTFPKRKHVIGCHRNKSSNELIDSHNYYSLRVLQPSNSAEL